MAGRVFISGDRHGDLSFLPNFVLYHQPDENDFLIFLGDLGVNYYLNKTDKKKKDKLAELPCKIICLHGNHEARPSSISSYQLIYVELLKCNCWVEPAYPNILFPEDGLMYINDYSFLVMGGAYSVDKEYRIMRGYQWFADEQMDEATKERILELSKDLKVDYVLSHTAPESEEPRYLFLRGLDQSKIDKSMEIFLDKIKKNVSFNHWFFGHYHDNKRLNNKFTILFDDTIILYSKP